MFSQNNSKLLIGELMFLSIFTYWQTLISLINRYILLQEKSTFEEGKCTNISPASQKYDMCKHERLLSVSTIWQSKEQFNQHARVQKVLSKGVQLWQRLF